MADDGWQVQRNKRNNRQRGESFSQGSSSRGATPDDRTRNEDRGYNRHGGDRGRGRGGRGGYMHVGRAPSTTGHYGRPLNSQMEGLAISSPWQNREPFSNTGKFDADRRSDGSGLSQTKTIQLLVNHFQVVYKQNTSIIQHEVTIKNKSSTGKELSGSDKGPSGSDLLAIRNDLKKSCIIAYDGKSNLYSTNEYPLDRRNFEVKVGSRTYSVTVEPKKNLILSQLSDPSARPEILQALHIIMKEDSSSAKTFDTSTGISLPGGALALPELRQTLNYAKQGLSVCADYSYDPFYHSGPVLDYIKNVLKIDYTKKLNASQLSFLTEALQGLRLTVTHRKTNVKFNVNGLTKSASAINFQDDKGNDVKLVNYYKDCYGMEIKHPELPCLDLSKGRQNYVPMEFCKISEWQKYPKGKMLKDDEETMRKLACSLPDERIKKILDLMKEQCRGKIAEHFGLSLNAKMTEVTGRVLEAPDLKIGSSNGQGHYNLHIDKANCGWNYCEKKLLQPKKLKLWSILDFTAGERRPLERDDFIYYIVKKCRSLGIDMADKPVNIVDSKMSILLDRNQLSRQLDRASKGADGVTKVELLFCPMTEQHNGYGTMKFICEIELGIMTQCFCLSKKSAKKKGHQDQYFTNLALNINKKLGGTNMELLKQHPKVADVPFMFIGADVNHPSPNDDTSPSIAAVVGSIDYPGASRYASRIWSLGSRSEEICNVGKMCSELIKVYEETNECKPQNIIYFRDGVSDGQFQMVLQKELEDIRENIRSKDYKPSITVVVAKKRHRTRLFPNPESAPRTTKGNVPPGTVVDSIVVDPADVDFYLCSDDGILGTSKPAHYYKLHDDHNFTSRELQELVYNLCFTFARCTKPVSLVTPVYYADLAAYRGRLYYDSDKTSFDLNGRARLHENVLNEMFFL